MAFWGTTKLVSRFFPYHHRPTYLPTYLLFFSPFSIPPYVYFVSSCYFFLSCFSLYVSLSNGHHGMHRRGIITAAS